MKYKDTTSTGVTRKSLNFKSISAGAVVIMASSNPDYAVYSRDATDEYTKSYLKLRMTVYLESSDEEKLRKLI